LISAVHIALALLAAEPPLPLGERDTAGVMDVETGQIVWAHNPRLLAQTEAMPGSIFKVVAAYAALLTPGFDPHARFTCQGSRGADKCWRPEGHGPMNLAKALAYSCNLYFRDLAERISPEDVLSAARRFGLGHSTGSDLPREAAGSLPTVVHDPRLLFTGQAEGLLVTPLQVLSLTAALGNGGLLLQPHLGAGDPESRGLLENMPALRFVRDALEEASRFGTGAERNLSEVDLLGKTGTVAWREVAWRTHGWFLGLWPKARPRRALVVFVHLGRGGGEAALAARAIAVELARSPN